MPKYLPLVSKLLDPTALHFINALRAALPKANQESIYWGYMFLLGAVVQIMAGTGRIEQLSRGLCTTEDINAAMREIVPFVCHGLRASNAPRSSSTPIARHASYSSGNRIADHRGRETVQIVRYRPRERHDADLSRARDAAFRCRARRREPPLRSGHQRQTDHGDIPDALSLRSYRRNSGLMAHQPSAFCLGRPRGAVGAWGPPGTPVLMTAIAQAYEPDLDTRPHDIRLRLIGHEMESSKMLWRRNGVTVMAFVVEHGTGGIPAIGYRIDYKGHSVLYRAIRATTIRHQIWERCRSART